ncbi:MAG: ArgE/DapE family deacylase [Anaerolineales bacterium]
MDHWSDLSAAIAARREMATDLIQKMVRIPSDEGEGGVQTFITDWWRQRGVEPDVWEPDIETLRQHPGFVDVDYDYANRSNVVVMFKGAGGGRSLSLNGHMDVVPADPRGIWTHGGPWSGKYVGGRIYGRGAVDMKAGLAVAMIVMDALQDCGLQLKGDLQMQFVVDEENGGNGTLAAILRGYRSDGTIFLEGTSPNFVVVSSRGAQFFRIIVPGIEGGIEYQFTQPNAIEKGLKLFEAVQSYALWRAAQADHPLYDYDPTKIPSAICKIQAGNWPSTLPAQCVMEGSIECLPGEDIELTKKQFRAYLLEAAKQDEWLRDNPPTIEWFGLRFEAGETATDDPLVSGLSAAAQAITGNKPAILGGGGSDLRLPVLYANSPSVLFGPAGGSIHSTDEYVEVDSVMQTAQIIAKFILDWCEPAQD